MRIYFIKQLYNIDIDNIDNNLGNLDNIGIILNNTPIIHYTLSKYNTLYDY